jgi:hypothetical protein
VKWQIVLLVALGVALGGGPAEAVVPGARTIVRKYAEVQALEHVAPSQLTGQARLPGRPEDLALTMDIAAKTCRAQVQTPQGTTLVSLGSGKITIAGPPLPALEAFAALACPFFWFRNVPAADASSTMLRMASSMGVDLNVTSLSRTAGRVGYVIGAAPRDLRSPQIWFDQATGRPLRVIAFHAGLLWDIRFSDAESIATNRLAPRVVDIWAGRERQLEMHLVAATPKITGDEEPAEVEEDAE